MSRMRKGEKGKRNINMKIATKEITKKGEHRGWKVYIDGRKFPGKPEDYYCLTSEELAISAALREAGVSEE
jgi:hypothetical protein